MGHQSLRSVHGLSRPGVSDLSVGSDIHMIYADRNYLVPALILLLGIILAVTPALADDVEDAEIRGAEIADAIEERGSGFADYQVNMTMVLRNRQGQESLRRLRSKVLEVEEDGDKTLFVFNDPRDVKGTAFLVHAHQDGPDEQWLYLPAVKRIKRIATGNLSASFMGSEFSYEDMGSQGKGDHLYRYLHEETCGELELACHVLERTPTEKGSGYSHHIVWYDQEHLRLWKVEFFDRKEAHIKNLDCFRTMSSTWAATGTRETWKW